MTDRSPSVRSTSVVLATLAPSSVVLDGALTGSDEIVVLDMGVGVIVGEPPGSTATQET